MTVELGRLTLFVTGDAPRSRRARANLADAMHCAGGDLASVDEVDLLTNPQMALTYGIFATPALMFDSVNNELNIMYGDLSETTKLESFLSSWMSNATREANTG